MTSGFSAGIATSGEAIGREGNKALSCDDELLSFNCVGVSHLFSITALVNPASKWSDFVC